MMKEHELIRQFWAKDAEYHFSDRETALYFYLVNVCNAGKWRNPFGLSNNMTIVRFGWGKNSLDRTRNRLKEAGLIDYRQGLGRGNISRYIIKGANSSSDEICVQASLFDNVKGYEKGNPANTFLEKEHEKGVQSDNFSDRSPEKEVEKEPQTAPFSMYFSGKEVEKDVQSDTFSNRFLEKDTQKDTFSDRFFSSKSAETEDFQQISSKNEIQYISISNNNIYDINNKNDMMNLKKEKDEEKEKSAVQKENEALDLYRTICASFPKIFHLTRNRKEKILRRLSEMGGTKILEQVFRKMEASEFLKGNNKYGWKATFDWVFKNPDNWVKIIEGNYDACTPRPQFVRPANDARFMGMLQTDLSKF